MRALVPALIAAAAMAGCVVTVDDSAPTSEGDATPTAAPPVADDPQAPPPPADPPTDPPTEPAEPPPGDPPPSEPPADEPPTDPVTDEPVDSWGTGGATPAATGGSCSDWTECAPHYANPNSGIDCDNGTCRCDVTGEWETACGSINGVWSANDCFCFVGASTPPADDADPPDDADEDVSCWWTWREWCEADRWVDTSYYDYVCYGSDDCGYEYVEDGYYEDGACTRRWIKRCSDGYDYWY